MTDLNAVPAGTTEVHDLLKITTLEQLRVFADPLRQQIVESILDQSKTVKQIARELGLAQTKLYYHINLLEEHGFIHVTDTRIVSGIIEKQYRSAARSFAISRSLLNPGTDDGAGLAAALDAALEPLRAEIQRSVLDGTIETGDEPDPARRLNFHRVQSRMPPEKALEFHKRLHELLEEFDKADDSSLESDIEFELVAILYPVRRPRHIADEE
jgi:DNA-binding transcriptional ArsR family regulator